jgi:hypothetical protein
LIRRIAIILLGLMLILAPAAPAFAADSGNGTLTGQLINGTPGGGGSVADKEVTLITYLNGSPLADTPTMRTDADGRFTFSGLDTGPEYGYDTVASYEGVDYWSELSDTGDLPAFAPGQTDLNIIIKVYETGADEGSVFLMLSHMILSAQADSVLVTEYYVFVTTDNRTFVGNTGDPGVLHFSLPNGAAGLEVAYGPGQNQVVAEADGFWDTRPVRPGGSEVGYTYTLAWRSGKLDLTRPVDYPTARLDLVVPEGSLDITGPGIVSEDSISIGGNVYAHYSAEDLVPGQDLTMTISRASGGGPGVVWLVLLGLLAVVVVLAAVYLFRRRRPAAVPVGGDTVSRQQQLLGELAELDDRFDAGEIDEADYRKLRDAKKTELARLMRSQRGE